MIMDYVDVDLPERSYLVEWDSVCLEHRQSTDLFIPQVWLAFLKEKAMWIAANPGRQEEFFKHLGYLLLRDAIDQQAYEEAKKLVTEAMSSKTIQSRQAKSGEPDQLGGDVSPKEQASRKYPKCNTCGAVLAGMVCTLECSNSVGFIFLKKMRLAVVNMSRQACSTSNWSNRSSNFADMRKAVPRRLRPGGGYHHEPDDRIMALQPLHMPRLDKRLCPTLGSGCVAVV
jgi:hypothetical protein